VASCDSTFIRRLSEISGILERESFRRGVGRKNTPDRTRQERISEAQGELALDFMKDTPMVNYALYQECITVFTEFEM